MRCDNVSSLHLVEIIHDDASAIVGHCKICGDQQVFRKDPDGRVDNHTYSEFFKRDIIQPDQTLFFKYHPERVETA